MRSDAHRSLEGEIPIERKLGVEIVRPEGVLRASGVEIVAVGRNAEAAEAVAIGMIATMNAAMTEMKAGVVKVAADGLSVVTASRIVDRPRGKQSQKRSSKPWRTPRESRRGK
jgi:hypothetical protein